MTNLYNLVRLRFPKKFQRAVFTIICNSSSMVLEKKVGNGPKAIIYTAEFSIRESYTLFLLELVRLNPNKYTLYFFRRKLRPSKRVGKYGTCIMFDARKLYSKYLAQHDDLIFFLPHQIFSEAILSTSEKSQIKHRTACLQHGHYNYTSADASIYSASNRTDHAFIYELNKKTEYFFRNVKNLHEIGYYFVDPKPSELGVTQGISIVLTKISNEELLQCLDYVFCKFGNAQPYKICLHPHQKALKSKIAKILNFSTVSYEFTDLPLQGDINIFYETTAYYSFGNLFGKNYFLSRDLELSSLESLSFSEAISKLDHHITRSLK